MANYKSHITRVILLEFCHAPRGRRTKVAYFGSILLLSLLKHVVCVGHGSGRRKFGSKAPLDLLPRSLRPSNQMALAKRRHG
jgi:hypothetical protein